MAKSFISRSWSSQPISTSILRLWLGFTWIFAGWNKATDAGFLNPSSSHYIGAQLTGYLGSSPIAFFLRRLIEHATLVGWFVMLSEFAIGIAILTGVALSLAALGGLGMSVGLWLSSSWSVHPYFLGSDTAYAILWLVLLVSLHQKSAKSGQRGTGRSAKLIPDITDRREVLRLLGVGIAAVGGALVGGRFKKKIALPLAGTAIVKLADFPVGSTKNFQAADGNAAILFRTKAGVFAYSAVCTHQGCIVSYSTTSQWIECPCHGAAYDPNRNAEVVRGPAPAPLAKIKVAISGSNIVQL